jgi:hypothetical protein
MEINILNKAAEVSKNGLGNAQEEINNGEQTAVLDALKSNRWPNEATVSRQKPNRSSPASGSSP